MSSIDRTVYSPGHEGRIYESTANASRWTIDTLENRYTRISVIKSFTSRRSILKGSQTPLRYNSPLFQYEREKKRARLVQRRVSFAPDAQIRMFMEGDSPDLSNRSVPNLIEETEPTIMMNNAFGSPFFEHQQRLDYKI
ncbi:uncharacterized protein BX663DRAFT_184981 [Cokeromyces recurvatus]|uniref:uncharacterized protein n=1 Tax=Cokeromyces recurvatus TaxID=90255 RepID=UPI00222047B8|nr:uncharacterized protein BX663DRAFT_184981 [Cokeromyces recurvatus]KAI7899599.1 hypothetical protein BX663DRAFT_184981 [Cokeromyces recurvatus]